MNNYKHQKGGGNNMRKISKKFSREKLYEFKYELLKSYLGTKNRIKGIFEKLVQKIRTKTQEKKKKEINEKLQVLYGIKPHKITIIHHVVLVEDSRRIDYHDSYLFTDKCELLIGPFYNEFDEPIIDKEEAIIEMNGKWGMIFVYGRFGKVKTLIPMRFKEVFRSYRLGKRIVEVMRIDSYGNRVTNVYNLNRTMDEIREEYFKKLRGKLKRSR